MFLYILYCIFHYSCSFEHNDVAKYLVFKLHAYIRVPVLHVIVRSILTTKISVYTKCMYNGEIKFQLTTLFLMFYF